MHHKPLKVINILLKKIFQNRKHETSIYRKKVGRSPTSKQTKS